MSKIVALIDCNNFYVSCEQVFDPKLLNKPVVVLSNNDGCVISRSKEAKEAGIEMGAPIFKCNEIVKKYDVRILSANFSLYGDMSNRIMNTITYLCPEIEVYSIDEAFVEFDSKNMENVEEYIKYIKETIKKWTGIPVSIGASTTKTLAKLTNKIAKKNKEFNGVFSLLGDKNLDEYLEKIEVSDVWGIGRSSTKLLNENNIYNAKQLSKLPYSWAKKYLKTPGLKTVLELKGIPCIKVEEVVKPKKSIITSRSFGKDIKNIEEMKEAISSFITIATEKLRKQKSIASLINVFVISNPFKEGLKYFNSNTVYLPSATADTFELIKHSLRGLEKIYKENVNYKKAGIMLAGIIPETNVNSTLFHKDYIKGKEEEFIKAMDIINIRYGRNTLFPASNGIEHNWKMKQLKKSKCYTTQWDELPIVKI